MWHKLRQGIGEWRGVLAIAPSVAALVIAGSAAGVFQMLEWGTLDQFFHLRPAEPIDRRIVLVTIGESDISKVGQWPMPDRVLAQLLRVVKAQQPRAIGMDIYRDLSVEPGHKELVAVFQSTANLIGIEKVGGNRIPPPPVLSKFDRVAASDLVLDADGKVRRALILIGTPDGQFREGLGAKLALAYLESEGVSLRSIDAKKKIYGLGGAVFLPLTGNEGGYVAGDTGGYQILLNFRGGLDKFPSISMTDVLENRIPPDLMRNRAVLIGSTAESLKDVFQTPYSSTLFATTTLTPGAVIHANITSQILSAALQGRPMLRVPTKTQNWLWILAWSFAGASGCLKLLQTNAFKKNVFFGGAVCCIILGGGFLTGTSYLAFLGGWIIPVFSPLLGLTASAILMANYHSQWQLKLANEKLENANEQLEEYSRTLEIKVAERTGELKSALDHLKATQSQLIQAEKMAALGQLVAGIAHEINNPTSFIYGNVAHAEEYASKLVNLLALYQKHCPPSPDIRELIEDIDLDYMLEDFPKLLTSMKTGASRIREIVKSLRTFSRLDESELKSVDIHEGIDSTLMILQNRLKQRGGREIQVVKEYGELPLVPCYAGQLNQVFMNLLTNAIDALDERNSKLKPEELAANPSLIKIATAVKDSSQIAIAISDNGPGIPEAIQQRLFDPFFTTKPVGKGTGLGLSISHSIVVEQHGGHLRVHSAPGQGSEFRIEIPMQPSKGRKQAPPQMNCA
jgi:adenylate cyclase